MTATPQLLDRVRKLLALASSPNVHEAAAAAAMAQTLIERHRLEGWLQGDLTAAASPIDDGRDSPLDRARRIRKWRTVLAASIADANGCVAYVQRQGREEALVVVGHAADRAAVATLWDWLVKQIEWLSATHGPGQPRSWHDAFRVGAAAAVGERLAAVAGAVRAEQPTGAMVRLDPMRLARQAALDAFVDEHLELGRGRSIRVRADAWQQGKAAAAELRLGTPAPKLTD